MQATMNGELCFGCHRIKVNRTDGLRLTIEEQTRDGTLSMELTMTNAEDLIGVLAAQLAIGRAGNLQSPTENSR